MGLGFNQIQTFDFLTSNKGNLENLEILEIEQNKIVSIQENDFDSNQKLSFLNLNSNPIGNILNKALGKLINLRTLKISKTNLSSLTLSESLKELDLSLLNNVAISNKELLTNIEWINLSNSKLKNVSFDLFLSNSTKFVDFSLNHFSCDDFKMFKVLGNNMETLKLSRTNLQQIDQIDFRNMINLKYLDLSFNNLTFVNSTSFDIIKNLEYLDLSWNKLFDLMLF